VTIEATGLKFSKNAPRIVKKFAPIKVGEKSGAPLGATVRGGPFLQPFDAVWYSESHISTTGGAQRKVRFLFEFARGQGLDSLRKDIVVEDKKFSPVHLLGMRPYGETVHVSIETLDRGLIDQRTIVNIRFLSKEDDDELCRLMRSSSDSNPEVVDRWLLLDLLKNNEMMYLAKSLLEDWTKDEPKSAWLHELKIISQWIDERGNPGGW